MSPATGFDLVIVGAGIAGGILAAMLAQENFKIAIIDSNSLAKKQIIPASTSTESTDPGMVDARVFAISRASEQVFRAAGIWEDIEQSAMGHFREMEVWDANGSGSIHFNSKKLCEPTLGYIIENRIIQNAVNTRLSSFENITCHYPATVEHLNISDTQAEVTLDNGTHLRAKLIIGADGANSRIRQLANINSSTYDYQQTALVCTVKSQVAHHDIARQRFMETGPLAFLPLADPHTCSIVWSTTHEQAQRLIEMPQDDFHHALSEAFDFTLGGILQTGPRFTFSLSRIHAKNYVQHRLALIGDAAHRVHPLAGQGANLGILDAACLAEVLSKQREKDIGLTAILRQYERWRKGENLAVLMAMDGFKHLFGSGQSTLQKLRNHGLNTVNALPGIKRQIMMRAMGLSGDLPKVAQIRHFL